MCMEREGVGKRERGKGKGVERKDRRPNVKLLPTMLVPIFSVRLRDKCERYIGDAAYSFPSRSAGLVQLQLWLNHS